MNLYVVYKADRLGGPFGLYSAPCRLDVPVDVLAEFPGRGDLRFALQNKLKVHAILKDVMWFDTTLEDIFSHMGDLMDDCLRQDYEHHFAEEMDIE
jgi:hypothetical protein